MSSIVNKVKEALHSDKSDTTNSSTTHNTSTTTHNTSGAPEGSYGPHGSRVANAADPRVDSDRDGSHNTGAHNTGAQHTTAHQQSTHSNYAHGTANPGIHQQDGSETGTYAHGTGNPGVHRNAAHDNQHGSSTGGYVHGTGLGANTGAPGYDKHNAREGHNYGSDAGGYIQGVGPTQASHDTGLGASAGSAGFGHHNQGTHSQGTHNQGTREGEHGPHSSRVANAADPRVDSDRDGSRNAGAATGNTFGSSTHTGSQPGFGSSTHTGNQGLSSSTHAGNQSFTQGSNTGAREGEFGPHGTRTANALDPRVDSDRDGSHNLGGNNSRNNAGFTNNSGNNAGFANNSHGPGAAGYGSATHGNAAHTNQGFGTGHTNATDNQGFGTGHTNTAGNQGFGTGHNTTGAGNQGFGGNSGPGPAPKTAGPHKSDMVNKLDPRVDSDLDGSKTVGGNKTYQSGTNQSSLAHKDPTDAAQVPPSVLAKTIGEPTIAHEDHHHGRERRNSSATHQETYRGV